MTQTDEQRAKNRATSLANLAKSPRTGRPKHAKGLVQTNNEAKVDGPLHQRGYELWRAGLNATEIRKRLHVSKSTWKWLLQAGSRRMPSYEDMLVDEVASIRNSASKIALELSESSVTVLRDRMTAAGKANTIINGVLDRALNGDMDAVDPSLLKALVPIANVTPVAEAFQKIYGGSVAMRGLHPTMDHAQSEYRPALEAVQGGAETDSSLLPAEKRDEIVQDMGGWSDEEIETFAKTGVEPAPGQR